MDKKNIRGNYICNSIILLLLITGCSMYYSRYSNIPVPEMYGAREYSNLNEQQKRSFLKNHEGYDVSTVNAILNGKIRIGMTKDQVIYSWGRPNDINRTVGSWGIHEQWVYDRGDYNSQYLYFEDGILTSWQD